MGVVVPRTTVIPTSPPQADDGGIWPYIVSNSTGAARFLRATSGAVGMTGKAADSVMHPL